MKSSAGPLTGAPIPGCGRNNIGAKSPLTSGEPGADHAHNMHDSGLVSAGPMLSSLSSLGILEPIPLEDLGSGKIRAFIYYVNWRVLDNSLLICVFITWTSNRKPIWLKT